MDFGAGEQPCPGAAASLTASARRCTLTGKLVLVACNLKAAKLGGFPSNGMVFCATSEDKSKVPSLLQSHTKRLSSNARTGPKRCQISVLPIQRHWLLRTG